MNKRILSIINNSIIVILTAFACYCTFSGFTFMPTKFVLTVRGLSNFKYFTVDSNIFVGLVSFVFIILEILVLKKKIKKIPVWLYVIKHVATTSIAITFFTTLLFLGPTIETGFFSLYTNGNLFFHLIIPVLAMLGYILFDKYKNKYVYCLYSIIPFIMYSFYYVPNVFTHLVDGHTINTYDFYGFFHGNPNSIYVFYPIMLIVVYTLSSILYWFNNKTLKK